MSGSSGMASRHFGAGESGRLMILVENDEHARELPAAVGAAVRAAQRHLVLVVAFGSARVQRCGVAVDIDDAVHQPVPDAGGGARQVSYRLGAVALADVG